MLRLVWEFAWYATLAARKNLSHELWLREGQSYLFAEVLEGEIEG